MRQLRERPATAADYAQDFVIPCVECQAEVGEPCKGLTPPAFVHFVRRLKRLLIEKRPDLLEPPS